VRLPSFFQANTDRWCWSFERKLAVFSFALALIALSLNTYVIWSQGDDLYMSNQVDR
jgi:hypothetical protein